MRNLIVTLIVLYVFSTDNKNAVALEDFAFEDVLAFDRVFYEAVYFVEDDIPNIIPKPIIEVTPGAFVEVVGEYADYFGYLDGSIVPFKLLDPDILQNTYIDVTIQATLGTATAEAVLIITMPGMVNLNFGQILYETVYSIEDDEHTINPLPVIEVTPGAVVKVIGDYEEYFEYNDWDGSITLVLPLPDEILLNTYIDVTIQATLGASTAEAVLVVTMPERESLRFNTTVYETAYSVKDNKPNIDPIPIIEVTSGAIVKVIGEYEEYFAYKVLDGSIMLTQPLTEDMLSYSNIVVKIQASLGTDTTEAILVVTMPTKEYLEFNKTLYETTYFLDGDIPTIEPKPIIEVSPGAIVKVIGEYEEYFAYQLSDESIELIQPLTDDMVNKNNIVVKIQASIGSDSVEAVLVVTMPRKENVKFNQILYEAVYSVTDDKPIIDPKPIIEVTPGALVKVIGEYADFFEYQNGSIIPLQLLDDNILQNTYIDVTIQAILGSETAEAVLVVTMPGKENLKFGQILYETVYFVADNKPVIDPNPIIEVTPGAFVKVVGEYAAYFGYQDGSIVPLKLLDGDILQNIYIDVTIQATLGLTTAEAVLIVTISSYSPSFPTSDLERKS